MSFDLAIDNFASPAPISIMVRVKDVAVVLENSNSVADVCAVADAVCMERAGAPPPLSAGVLRALLKQADRRGLAAAGLIFCDDDPARAHDVDLRYRCVSLRRTRAWATVALVVAHQQLPSWGDARCRRCSTSRTHNRISVLIIHVIPLTFCRATITTPGMFVQYGRRALRA